MKNTVVMGMPKGEWLKRCAARYREVRSLGVEAADFAAEVCLDELALFAAGAAGRTPEEAADMDMACWKPLRAAGSAGAWE